MGRNEGYALIMGLFQDAGSNEAGSLDAYPSRTLRYFSRIAIPSGVSSFRLPTNSTIFLR